MARLRLMPGPRAAWHGPPPACRGGLVGAPSPVLNEAELTPVLWWMPLCFWAIGGRLLPGQMMPRTAGHACWVTAHRGKCRWIRGVRASWQNLAACLISSPMSSLGSHCGPCPIWTPALRRALPSALGVHSPLPTSLDGLRHPVQPSSS